MSREQRDIRNAAREFAEAEFPKYARECDQREVFPTELWKTASQLGFIGAYLSEEHGGGGFGLLEHCMLMEEFWRVDPGCGCILLTAFGSKLIEWYGTPEQKKRYLPPLTRGEAIMGTAITEPDAGSDIFGTSTLAQRRGNEYVINGSKMFITSGTISDYLAVYCLTDPERKTKAERYGIVLVETDRPGVERTKITGKLGIRASDTAEVVFRDVRVPAENLIGGDREGFPQIMSLFNFARVEAAAQGVGVAQGSFEKAVKYARKRRAFGQPLGSFQGIQWKIAEMATMIENARHLYYKSAWLYDSGKIDRAMIAMAKWYGGQTGVRVADEALQLHGGYGFMAEYDVERFYRDAKIVEIYEATKEIEKNTIAREILGRL
jgi:alkylation response protein AidB-like acyl-CoA dehydrogenase